MAVRQYIGARYVPKLMGEWDKNISYESLVIVTYKGNSFTSKQPVPQGIEINDTNYWVNTGNYNGYIAELNTKIEELDSKINASDEKIEILSLNLNRKYVLIGDSYNTGNGWGEVVKNRLNLIDNINVWNSGIGGASFHYGTFLNQLVSIDNGLTDAQRNTITDIVVVGCVNDWSGGEGEIKKGVEDFENYVKLHFPNAKYWVILGGWSYENDTIRQGIVSAYNVINESTKFGKVINNVFLNFIDPYFLQDDMSHPTTAGMNILGISVSNILMGGDYYFKGYTDLQTLFSGVRIKGNVTPNGVHIYKHTPEVFTFPEAVTISGNSNFTLLGNADLVNNLFERNAEFTADCIYKINTSYKTGKVLCKVFKNDNRSWTLKASSIDVIDGEDGYDVHNVSAMNLIIDTVLDYYAN